MMGQNNSYCTQIYWYPFELCIHTNSYGPQEKKCDLLWNTCVSCHCCMGVLFSRYSVVSCSKILHKILMKKVKSLGSPFFLKLLCKTSKHCSINSIWKIITWIIRLNLRVHLDRIRGEYRHRHTCFIFLYKSGYKYFICVDVKYTHSLYLLD